MRESSSRATDVARAYGLHASFVRRSLRRFGVTHADVDDAVQRVFLVVDRRLDEYADISKKRAWLRSVCKFTSQNYLRGQRREEARFLGLVVAPPPELDEIVAAREAQRILDAFLHKLGKAQGLTFYLADFEGLTAGEIAAELDVNMNTVRSRLRTARLRLEATLVRHRLREPLGTRS